MGKMEDLRLLDKLVRDKMIAILADKDSDTTELRDLATVTNYLKANSFVEDKKKDDVSEQVKKRVEEAKKRREQKFNKQVQ